MKLFSKRVYKPIIIMFITTKTEGASGLSICHDIPTLNK